ncbi:MAG: hypothetical protein RLZZ292_2326 [Bacteroidota bacterium]|jgi:uncharacterized protein (DUF2141 family)
MKNDTNSWDEILRQRLLEAEQDSDYPVWNEHRVWQKAQQQLTEHQVVVPRKQPKRHVAFWYAAAAMLLLGFPSSQRGDTKIAVEISTISPQKGNVAIAVETSMTKAQKENIKHFFIKKENKNKKNLETTTYSFVKEGRVGEALEDIPQKYKIADLNYIDIPNIPPLGVGLLHLKKGCIFAE